MAEHLAAQGVPVQKITFPDYTSDSSALVKMYLAGQFGQHPDDVNAYAASSFYAVDRYASCVLETREDQRITLRSKDLAGAEEFESIDALAATPRPCPAIRPRLRTIRSTSRVSSRSRPASLAPGQPSR